MRILIDTREQRPLPFPSEAETARATLKVGDYTIEGFEDEVVVERKSLSDLMGSISHDRERFIKELRRMRSYRLSVIVIEGSWADIEHQRYKQNVHPNAVVGSLVAFVVKYGVIPIMGHDRITAGQITYRLLSCFAKRIEHDHRKLIKSREAASAGVKS